MTIFLSAIAALASGYSHQSGESFDYSRSYAVWVAPFDGRTCRYFVTDVPETAKELTADTRHNYDHKLGVELLTAADTLTRCIVDGRRALSKAGFRQVGVRMAASHDRPPRVP